MTHSNPIVCQRTNGSTIFEVAMILIKICRVKNIYEQTKFTKTYYPIQIIL